MGANRISSGARIALVVAVAAAVTVVGLDAAGEAPAKRRPRHHPPYILPTFVSGDVCLDKPHVLNVATVSDSKVVKIPIFVPVGKGNLLLAPVASEGKVRPPSGWSALSATGHPRKGLRLQVFYKVLRHALDRAPRSGVFASYSFTSSTRQRIAGGILWVQGVSGRRPISAFAGQVNPGSDFPRAPSVRPTSKDALLVFVGAARRSVNWSAPRGMRPWDSQAQPYEARPPSPVFIATERWHPATATGGRTARISMSSRSVGQLIALHFPRPVTCPKVTVVNSWAHANRRFMFVRMHCAWGARCRGRYKVFDNETPVAPPYFGKTIAVGRYSIPAGKTRSVPIALTRVGRKALAALHIVAVDSVLWGVRSNGQSVLRRSGEEFVYR